MFFCGWLFGQMRDAFGDQLFLRTPTGMEPTAVALKLEPKVRLVVETLSEAISQPAVFDPATSQDVLRIGAYDNEMTTLVPDLLKLIRAQAPGMRISILPLGRRPAFDALEHRETDLALGFAWDLPRSIRADKLYDETYCVVMRKGHALGGGKVTLKSYLGAEHLIVSPGGDLSGIVDIELQKSGHSRRVAVSVPHFLPALSIVSSTDLIATLPSRLVAKQSQRFGLTAVRPPIDVRAFSVSAFRHERDANNPMHAWMIECLRAVAGSLEQGI